VVSLETMKGNHNISILVRQYFNKNVLPFWCVLLIDTAIIFLSFLFSYWVSNREGTIFDNRCAVIYTALLYSGLCWIGARVFKTYSGIVRYSSFVDLLKVAYSNFITLFLALFCSIVFRWQGVNILSAFSSLEIVSAIAIATLLMWAVRIVVWIMRFVG